MEEIGDLKKVMRPGYISIFLILILLAPLALIFAFHEKDWNFMWELFELIDSEKNGFYKDFLLVVLGVGIPVIIGFLSKSVKERIIDTSRKIKRLKGNQK